MEERQQVPNQNPIAPAQPITTYPTPQPAPTSKTPWILISLIVTLLGVSSYFGYQNYQLRRQLVGQQPTPSSTVIANSPMPTGSTVTATDPTANWKTYTNTEYNFTIKYPSDAKLRVSQSESNDRMLVVAFDSPNAVFDHLFKSGGYSFEISMQTQKNFNTIDEYLLFQKEHNMYEEVLPKTYNNVKGYTFKNDKGYSGLDFTYRGYVAKNNDLYYTINYFTDDSVDMFNQILSTFKFIN